MEAAKHGVPVVENTKRLRKGGVHVDARKNPGHCYRPDNDRLDLSVDFLIYRHAT